MDGTDEFLSDLAKMPEKIKEGHVPIPLEDGLDEPEREEEGSVEEEILDDEDGALVEVKHHEIMPAEEAEKMVDTHDAQKTEDFVLASCKKIVEQGFDTLSNLQDTVVATADGKTISGYANLIGSIGKVLDTANSVAQNKQRMAHQAKMEKLKAELKRQAAKSAPPTTKNTINIVAGREEIMKMLDNA